MSPEERALIFRALSFLIQKVEPKTEASIRLINQLWAADDKAMVEAVEARRP